MRRGPAWAWRLQDSSAHWWPDTWRALVLIAATGTVYAAGARYYRPLTDPWFSTGTGLVPLEAQARVVALIVTTIFLAGFLVGRHLGR